jgi:hypothetical protein
LLLLLNSSTISPSRPDGWKCTLDSSNVYSCKGAFDWIYSKGAASSVNLPTLSCLKLSWKSWAPLNRQIFCWSVLLDKFPSKAKLCLRGIPLEHVESLCCLCASTLETGTHLFVDCYFSRLVWNKILSWLNLSCQLSWDLKQILIALCGMVKGKNQTCVISMIWGCVIWSLWKVRNAKVFKNVEKGVEEVFNSIQSLLEVVSCKSKIFSGGFFGLVLLSSCLHHALRLIL